MRYTALLAAALLLAAPSAVSAQRASPEALATAVNQAVTGRDWKAFIDLIDRPDLERVQNTFGRVLDLAPEPELLSLFGVADAAAFRALDPKQVMLSFLDLAQVTQQLEGVEFLDTRVVGVVYETPDLAHAVIRQTMQLVDLAGGELSVADVVSMQQRDDGWYLLMGPELEGLLIGIESGLALGGG
jgi:hypothetical protein